jgi:CRP/FNR family transcriptional regulator
MEEEIANCLFCDRKAECFKYLTNAELSLLSESRSIVHYKKGETIVKQGTEFTHIVSFNSGLAKLYVEVGPERNVMIGIIKPTEILGGPGMFQNNKYSFSVTALTDATICLINAALFKKMIQSNVKFADTFLSSFSSRYIEAINRLVSITHKQMNGRVAEALLYLSRKIYSSESFELPITRQELAEYTGTSKESISRIFKDFSDDNLIAVDGREIKILDKEKLFQLQLKG